MIRFIKLNFLNNLNHIAKIFSLQIFRQWFPITHFIRWNILSRWKYKGIFNLLQVSREVSNYDTTCMSSSHLVYHKCFSCDVAGWSNTYIKSYVNFITCVIPVFHTCQSTWTNMSIKHGLVQSAIDCLLSVIIQIWRIIRLLCQRYTHL